MQNFNKANLHNFVPVSILYSSINYFTNSMSSQSSTPELKAPTSVPPKALPPVSTRSETGSSLIEFAMKFL